MDEKDQLLCQEDVGELGAGETKTRPLCVRLAGSASGMFVSAVVDANNDVAEPNENNNVIVSAPIQ